MLSNVDETLEYVLPKTSSDKTVMSLTVTFVGILTPTTSLTLIIVLNLGVMSVFKTLKVIALLSATDGTITDVITADFTVPVSGRCGPV